MDHQFDTHEFLKIDRFLNLHPDVDIDELIALNYPIWYMTRLNGKSLKDLSPLDNEDKMHKFAKALQIKYYKGVHKTELYKMIVEKFHTVFTDDCDEEQESADSFITDKDTIIIQSDLLIGPPRQISAYDEHILTDYTTNDMIVFEEDKQGYRTIPTRSSVLDFFRPLIRTLYKNYYKCLKYYKGKYYQYTASENKWNVIDSLDEPVMELYNIIHKCMRRINEDFMTLHLYLDNNDKFKVWLRKELLKIMERIVRAYSETALNFKNHRNTRPTNHEEHKSPTDDINEYMRAIVDDVVEMAMVTSDANRNTMSNNCESEKDNNVDKNTNVIKFFSK